MKMEPTKKYPTGNNRVEAVYSDPVDPKDKGNILIEALPEQAPFIPEKTWTERPRNPSGPDVSADLRYREIEKLRTDIRFRMRFDEPLRRDFRLMLEASYARRWPHIRISGESVFFENKEVKLGLTQDNIIGEDSNSGLAILGISSSGKSKVVRYMLQEYPQLIIHNTIDGLVLQIPYVYVEAQTNDDVNAILIAIAKQLDRILQNNGKYEEKIMSSKYREPNKKCLLIQDLVEAFNIGAIVIDEIQKMSTSQKSGTLEAMDQITNSTKVAMVSIGTQEAFERIYSSAHRARRQGKPYHISKYCSDKGDFGRLVQELYKYQWFPEKVVLTDDMISTHFETAVGTIGELLEVYIEMNKASIEYEEYRKRHRNCKPLSIDSNFIRVIAKNKRSGQMERLREAMEEDNLYSYEKVGNSIKTGSGFDEQSQPAVKSISSTEEVLNRVFKYFKDNGEKYNPSTISKGVADVMKLETASKMTTNELVAKAICKVERGKTDSRKQQRLSPMADADIDNYSVPDNS